MKQPTFGKLIGEPDHPLWDLLQFIAVISGLVVILLLTASSFDETELKTIGAMVIVTVLVPALKRTLIKWRVPHRRFVNENPSFQQHERPCGGPVIFADMLSTRMTVWPNVNNSKPYLHINAHIRLNLIKRLKNNVDVNVTIKIPWRAFRDCACKRSHPDGFMCALRWTYGSRSASNQILLQRFSSRSSLRTPPNYKGKRTPKKSSVILPLLPPSRLLHQTVL